MSTFNGFEDLFTDDNSDYANESADAGFEAFDDIAEALTPADESAIFLETVMESCETPDEFIDMVTENAVYWQSFGLIDDADVALEAVKRITVDNWKQVNFKRLWHREALRVEARKDSADWKKYVKYRTEMRKVRAKIIQRNENVAKRNVRQAQSHASQKTASMNNSHGGDLNKRINEAMAKSTAGKNPTGTGTGSGKKVK